VELLECGKLVIAGQRELLAGAAVPLGLCVGKVMQFTDCSLTAAINMASQNPARLLHLPESQFPNLRDWVVFKIVENEFQAVQVGVAAC
jgi:N-acetylglucosamine-6-phosphate deacetylase